MNGNYSDSILTLGALGAPTMADLIMTTSMSSDIADYGFKMAATKPEQEITFER